MSVWLYSLGIYFYDLLLRLIAPFHTKARLFVEGRSAQHWRRFPQRNGSGPRVWMHVSSLGEFEQGRPIIEALHAQFPHLQFLLTFFSPSGFEIRKDYELADTVSYLPMDTASNARSFLASTKPDLILMVKYDFWIHHLKAAIQREIPVVYVSAIFRPDHVYFNAGKSLYLSTFRQITRFFVQNDHSASLLMSHQINQVAVSGDTRFDRVKGIASGAKAIPEIEQFLGDRKAFVMGSVWLDDLEHLTPVIEYLSEQYVFLIAPHQIHERELLRMEEILPPAARFSTLPDSEKDILLIDNIGMLSSLYRYGTYAYIGGAFHGGLHNTLEAAVYGIPVLFGRHPRNRKFNEATGLLTCGGAFDFANSEEAIEQVTRLEQSAELYRQSSVAAGDYVASRTGATEKVVSYLGQFLT